MIKDSTDEWIALSNIICPDDETCECNSLESSWKRDFGRVTEKANLPITAFQYGDLTDDNAKANFKIGPLTCQGNKNPFIVQNEIRKFDDKFNMEIQKINDKVNSITRKVDENAVKINEKSDEIISNSQQIVQNSGKIDENAVKIDEKSDEIIANSRQLTTNSRQIVQNSDKIDETTRKVDEQSGKINKVISNTNKIAALKSTIEDKWAKDKDSRVIFMAYM